MRFSRQPHPTLHTIYLAPVPDKLFLEMGNVGQPGARIIIARLLRPGHPDHTYNDRFCQFGPWIVRSSRCLNSPPSCSLYLPLRLHWPWRHAKPLQYSSLQYLTDSCRQILPHGLTLHRLFVQADGRVRADRVYLQARVLSDLFTSS